MSKDLPYFRFTAFEWLNDDISLENYETKGVFADVCAYYWFKNCSITKAKLEQRFSDALTSIEALFNSEIIKLKNGSDFIEISFLNTQFDQLSQLRRVRQDAGRKGGQQSLSKPKAKPKQNRSYKDKDNNKDKDNKSFSVFWDLYDKKVGDKSKCEKKWIALSDSERQKIFDTLPAFKASIKDKQYQPHPETYLNQKRWNDEIKVTYEYDPSRIPITADTK